MSLKSDRLNIVLVGANGKVAAPAHLNALANVPGAVLYGVCDVDTENVDHLARLTGAYPFTSLDDVLADPNVDGIDLVTPPFIHAEQTVAAAHAGKHVYCEKPMAHSLSQASAMIQAHRESGTTLMVGESYVFHHPNMAARAVIDSGDIGDVLHIRETKGPWLMKPEESKRLSGTNHELNAPWRVDPKMSGGGKYPWIMDHAPHFFAIARYFANNATVDLITAHAQRRQISDEKISGIGAVNGQAITSVAWSFNNGIDSIWSQIESSAASLVDVGFMTIIHGTKGSLQVYGEGGGAAPGRKQVPAVILNCNGRSSVIDAGNPDDRAWQSNNNYYDASHQTALNHWIDSIIQAKPVRYPGEEGRIDLASVLATIKSAEERRSISPIEIDENWTAY